MIKMHAFAGKAFAVLGLARSGLGAAEALIASGADVLAWDKREQPRRKAAAMGARIGNPVKYDLTDFAAVVVSPGIALRYHPIAAHARKAGVPLIGDIELFAQARAELPPHRVIGITGTNGKSTVTALIHHILREAAIPALMGGNIGLPILSCEVLPAGGVYVLELSSYQIDLTLSLACDIAVLTNISPDHLDRYEGFSDYAAAKERLFALQHIGGQAGGQTGGQDAAKHDTSRLAVIAVDDEPSRMIANRLATGGVGRSLKRVTGEEMGTLLRRAQKDWPALQGPHNAQNTVCAIAACEAVGVAPEQIAQALVSFPGLPHRMEFVAEVGGARWYNDSKATNAASSASALAAFPPTNRRRLHWIVGGKAKGDSLETCRSVFDHIACAYLIGESQEDFAGKLSAAMPIERCGTIDVAVALAAQRTTENDIILLSPACASFDQFRDFEHRGDYFRTLIERIGQ